MPANVGSCVIGRFVRHLICGVAALMIPAAAAIAGSFTVTTALDSTDATPGDGLCETAAGNGTCSLRAAIQEANASAGPDVVTLPAGTYLLTLTGEDEDACATGDLDVTIDEVTLIGAGETLTVIDGMESDRILDVFEAATVVVSGVTIQNGTVHGFSAPVLFRGGGVRNFGCLTLDHVTVSQSSIDAQTDHNARGGGVYNAGTACLYDVNLFDNALRGFTAYGGGLYNDGVASLRRVVVRTNTGLGSLAAGGGIYNTSTGELNLVDATVDSNHSGGSVGSGTGGGVTNQGIVTMTRVTISRNTSSGHLLSGRFPGFHNEATATLTNVTVSGNHSIGSNSSGALRNEGTLVAAFVAVVENGWDAQVSNFGSFTARGTIVATLQEVGGDTCRGAAIVSAGHNLDEQDTCGFNDPTDIVSTPPLLAELSDNGGFSETHALQPGSPAIDAGGNAGFPPTDQRRVGRPQGSASDIGPFEREAPSLPQTMIFAGDFEWGDTSAWICVGCDPCRGPLPGLLQVRLAPGPVTPARCCDAPK